MGSIMLPEKFYSKRGKQPQTKRMYLVLAVRDYLLMWLFEQETPDLWK